jgi:hypothetical protein
MAAERRHHLEARARADHPALTPPVNVYDEIDNDNSPTLPVERTYRWNILLDGPAE